jgi:hypothetical protein
MNDARWWRMVGWAIAYAGGTLQQRRFKESGLEINAFVQSEPARPAIPRPEWFRRMTHGDPRKAARRGTTEGKPT